MCLSPAPAEHCFDRETGFAVGFSFVASQTLARTGNRSLGLGSTLGKPLGCRGLAVGGTREFRDRTVGHGLKNSNRCLENMLGHMEKPFLFSSPGGGSQKKIVGNKQKD